MPGAELNEVVGESAWKATMHVKLGPIALQFGTDITRERADDTARSVVLQAKARELKGRGGARATIESRLSEVEGETSVTIVTDLSLEGAVAQYGRGIVADVSAQLTKQFAECLAAKLAAGGPGGASTPEDAAADGDRLEAPRRKVKPVGGVKLALVALLRSFGRLLRSRS
jgi:hypothetical protein